MLGWNQLVDSFTTYRVYEGETVTSAANTSIELQQDADGRDWAMTFLNPRFNISGYAPYVGHVMLLSVTLTVLSPPTAGNTDARNYGLNVSFSSHTGLTDVPGCRFTYDTTTPTTKTSLVKITGYPTSDWSGLYTQGYKCGAKYRVENVNLFDLTQIFGAGNEPSTLEEFREMYPANYYPYTSGYTTKEALSSYAPWFMGDCPNNKALRITTGNARPTFLISISRNGDQTLGYLAYVYLTYGAEHAACQVIIDSGITFLRGSNYVQFSRTSGNYNFDYAIIPLNNELSCYNISYV